MKFNIDGASNGNLGSIGYEGVLRDEHGGVLFIFYCHLGKSTNNMAELMAMVQWLDYLKQDNQKNVIVEAHSELIIESVKRIS